MSYQADLLGDDTPATSSTGPNVAPPATVQSNQDLLAEIFGSSNIPSTATTASPSQQQKSTVDDILGLFESSSRTPAPVSVAATSVAPSSLPPTPASAFPSASAISTPVQPPQQKPTAYPAYEKNGLKITLTPQPLAARPGVVMILARFQLTGAEAAKNLNFQAAVPKVYLLLFVGIDYLFLIIQSQQLQMLPMSNPSVSPGSVETQQMRVVAPVGVRFLFF